MFHLLNTLVTYFDQAAILSEHWKCCPSTLQEQKARMGTGFTGTDKTTKYGCYV